MRVGLAAAACTALLLACGGGGGGETPPTVDAGVDAVAQPDVLGIPASLVAVPAAPEFPVTACGETSHLAFALRSDGEAPVQVAELTLESAKGAYALLDPPSLPFTLAVGEERFVMVSFTPHPTAPGKVWLSVGWGPEGAAAFRELRVPLTATESSGLCQLVFDPEVLDFGQAQEHKASVRELTVTNDGSLPFLVTSATIQHGTRSDLGEFEIVDAGGWPPALVPAEEAVLAPGDSVVLAIGFTNTGGASGLAGAELLVRSPGGGSPDYHVPLKAVRTPNLDCEAALGPVAAYFDAHLPGGTEDAEFTLVNVGLGECHLDQLVVRDCAGGCPEPGGGGAVSGAFEVLDPPAPGEVVLASGESWSIGVRFLAPMPPGPHHGLLEVRLLDHNGPDGATQTYYLPSGKAPLPPNLQATTVAPNPVLTAVPTTIQFGTVWVGETSAAESITLQAGGNWPSEVSGWAHDCGSEVEVVEAPVLDDALPGGGLGLLLEPGETAGLSVVYAPVDAGADSCTLSVAASGEAVPVELFGNGYVPAPETLLEPAAVDFGKLPVGQASVPHAVAIEATGELPSEVVGWSHDCGPEVAIVDAPALDEPLSGGGLGLVLEPGQSAELALIYQPADIGFDACQLTVDASGEPTAVTLLGEGYVPAPECTLSPVAVDFGALPTECDSAPRTVLLSSTGELPTQIAGWSHDCGPEVTIVQAPTLADPLDGGGLGVVLEPGEEASLVLTYSPQDVAGDACALTVEADGELHQVVLVGEGTPGQMTEDFEQIDANLVDVLFVIDSSHSMEEEQATLAAGMASFVEAAAAWEANLRLGVTTMDMWAEAGALVGDPPVFTSAEVGDFAAAVMVGTDGASVEMGLAAAMAALSSPLIDDLGVACFDAGDCPAPYACVAGGCGGANRGFLRPTAGLELVLVSDEEDQSPLAVAAYLDFFEGIKGLGKPDWMHVHAFVGVDPAGCSSAAGVAEHAPRYVGVANATGGVAASICEADWEVALAEMGAVAFSSYDRFLLALPAELESIAVAIDGVACPSWEDDLNWSFDPGANLVVFWPGAGCSPGPGQTVTISYAVVCPG